LEIEIRLVPRSSRISALVLEVCDGASKLPGVFALAYVLDDFGPRIRVDYSPDGQYGRDWLRDLLADLSDDGLVAVEPQDDDTVAFLRR
jgi:hypothetical protein